MLAGVLQRLYITDQSKARLVLQEYPVLDYGVAILLTFLTMALSIAGSWISASVAGGFAIFFALQAKTRVITFDVASDSMLISVRSAFNSRHLSSADLATIQRAYLFKADDGSSQIVLVRADGEEMGLSVYSKDSEVRPWKEPLVIAINEILHDAHKTRDEQNSTV
ncbi:MAG: hypothetical protein AAFQ52_12115 [Chloroflexota bacterium]